MKTVIRFACIAAYALAVFLLTAVPSAAQAPPAQPAPPALGVPIDVNYVLGLGDIIDVSLVGRTDYSARSRVGPDGTVLLPLVGAIPAKDKTATELAEMVRQALEKGRFFSQVAVRVDVLAVASRYVTVLGQVGAPSLVPLDRAYRLSEILAKVGGQGAGAADYVVVTKASGEQQQYPISEIATGGSVQDPTVAPGDKIYIPSTLNHVFYVTGQVNAPGSYPTIPGLTVRMAIAKGGGVTETGNERKFELFRKGEKVRGANLETQIQVGDIIKVGERLF
jgi:polysaccharide biosynthesis/export protein